MGYPNLEKISQRIAILKLQFIKMLLFVRLWEYSDEQTKRLFKARINLYDRKSIRLKKKISGIT